MHIVKKFLSLICLLFVLNGCSHVADGMRGLADGFDQMGQDVSKVFDAEDRNNSVFTNSDRHGAQNPESYNRLAENFSNENVTVYTIDGVPPEVRGYRGDMDILPAYEGKKMTSLNDSGVTLYPFEGGDAWPPRVPSQLSSDQQRAAMPRLMPPRQAEPSYDSPFDGQRISATGFDLSPDNAARIYFGHGVVSLNAEQKGRVRSAARTAGSRLTGPLTVAGHASRRAEVNDPVQRRILNLKVSMERALKVSQELIRGGVPATAIRTIAYGDTQPPAAVPGMSPESASRRVDIQGLPAVSAQPQSFNESGSGPLTPPPSMQRNGGRTMTGPAFGEPLPVPSY